MIEALRPGVKAFFMRFRNPHGTTGVPLVYINDSVRELFSEKVLQLLKAAKLVAFGQMGIAVPYGNTRHLTPGHLTHELVHIARASGWMSAKHNRTKQVKQEILDNGRKVLDMAGQLYGTSSGSARADRAVDAVMRRIEELGAEGVQDRYNRMSDLGTVYSNDFAMEYEHDLRFEFAGVKDLAALFSRAGVIVDMTEPSQAYRAMVSYIHTAATDAYGYKPADLKMDYSSLEEESIAYHLGANQDQAGRVLQSIVDEMELTEEKKIKESGPKMKEFMEELGAPKMIIAPGPSQTVQPGTSPNTPMNIRAFGMPELVDIIRKMMDGKLDVKIWPRLTAAKGAQGRFRTTDGHIDLDAGLFANIQEASATLGHELGHMVDWMDEHLMGLTRGNTLGRIAKLKKFMKESYQNLAKNKEIRAELIQLTQAMKPFNEDANIAYTRYRYSSAELYADAISALVNDPAMLQKIAPKFTTGFFDYMYRMPKVKAIYDKIQSVMQDETTTNLWRLSVMEENLEKAEELLNKQLEREKEEWGKGLKSEMYFAFIDQRQRLIEAVKGLQKAGVRIDPEHDPLYWTEELPYIDNLQVRYWRDVSQQVVKPYKDAGIDDKDMAKYLILGRVIEYQLKGKAFAGGHTLKDAPGMYEALRDKVGPENFKLMGQLKAKLVDIRRKHVLPGVEKAQLFNDALMKEMWENEDYVTFFDTKYVMDLFHENSEFKGMHPQVYKILGGLDEQKLDPIVATAMKDAAMLRAAHVKMTAEYTVSTLRTYFGNDEVKDGTHTVGGRIKDAPDGFETIVVLHKSKIKAYYVRPRIALMFKHQPEQLHMTNKLISMFQRTIKGVFVRYNPVWVIRNLIRDTLEAYKKGPGVHLMALIKEQIKAMPEVYDDVFKQLSSSDVDEMYAGMMLVADRAYRHLEADERLSHIEKMLYAYSNTPKQAQTKWDTFYNHVLAPLDRWGQFTERLNKVATFKLTKRNIEEWKTRKAELEKMSSRTGSQEKDLRFINAQLDTLGAPKKLAHYIRSRVGTPDVYRAGRMSWLYNNIWLFSNVNKEGWRAHWEAYKEDRKHPWYESEYLFKMAWTTLAPKVLMFAMTVGMFGEWWKKWISNISEYNKSSYAALIPFGMTNEGESIYFRIPPDYAGQVIGNIAWRGMNLMRATLDKENYKYNPSEWTNMFDFMLDSTPYGSLNPYIGIAADLVDLLRGMNPYDSFTGKTIIPEYINKTGNTALKAQVFMGHLWNKLGGRTLAAKDLLAPVFKSETIPYIKKEFYEKFTDNVPLLGPMAWTFLQVSDYGKRQRYSWVATEVEEKDAQRSYDKRERIWDSIKPYTDAGRLPPHTAAYNLYRDLVKEGIVDRRTTSARDFWHTYNRYALRSENSREIDLIVFARTNHEKAALLDVYQKTLPPADYSRIVTQLRREGMLSGETMVALRKLQAEQARRK